MALTERDEKPKTRVAMWVKQHKSPVTSMKPEANGSRFQDLGLPGLSTSCNSSISAIRKFIWGLLWLMAAVWCIVECTNCLIAFASSPFTANMKYKNNQSMTAPLITICPGDSKFRNPAVSAVLLEEIFGNSSYSSAVDLLGKYNMSIAELWNLSRFDVKKVDYFLFEVMEWLEGEQSLPPDKVEMNELLTVHGTCFTIKQNWPLSCMGMQNGIDIRGHMLTENFNNFPKYYTGIIHTEAETPIIRYTGTFSSGFYASYKHLTSIAVRVQELIHVNTWENPCQSEDTYLNCFITCIEKRIIAHSKLPPCRLPYMYEKLKLPLCTSAAEFLNMYKATQITSKQTTARSCGCTKPCTQLRYSEEYIINSPDNYLFSLYIILPSCDIEVIEEVLMYGFTSFLSDIGGALGLFLGMSILSILEILEVLFLKMFSKRQKVVSM